MTLPGYIKKKIFNPQNKEPTCLPNQELCLADRLAPCYYGTFVGSFFDNLGLWEKDK